MRVLMTSLAVEAHFNGAVPLAWALRAAGHEVRVASQPALTGTITRAGLTAVPVGTDHVHHDLVRHLGAELTGFYRDIDFTGERGDDYLSLKGANTLLTATFYAQANNDAMVDELVDYARYWQPDLVIWEPFTFAGAVAARASGAAHARLLWGPDLFLRMRQAFRRHMELLPEELHDDTLEEWLTWTLDRFGCDFDEETVVGQWNIDQMPEGIRLPLGRPTVPMRYVPYNGRSVIPDWLREPPRRPRICLTLGITSRDMAYPNLVSLDELFEAVAELDVEIVATLTEAQRAEVARVPDNTRVTDFVPLHALLPSCSAAVHHGGAGTWSTAAVYGVPQLVIADMWDNVYRARRLADLGAGLFLPPDELTVAGLRDGLEQLLTKPSFHEDAQRLREAMVAEPSPAGVVPALEELTRQQRN
ncbi:activator-dependent family glycosyltransferase [Streptomyces resistomycificus]|uniref:Glycosyl transferase family 28 n=2 Tax=Streptomyces resistomycificus TaxID=67356 RepID=A0A0L8L2I7_9ACTN|nr:activator-dependent family glycosyltransferase [Streptomyces resistomycificus]KOG32276.1 glycosyl transferase family 28 [Streptomyces resistomycificus]KUN94640.1 glycosyl transferase family 28 [Streptomyces resistomycificus]